MLLTTFFSCKKCEEFFCEKGFFDLKECECVCEDAFEGKFCDQEVTQKFIGNWLANDFCIGNENKNVDYTAKISLTNSKNLIVQNLLGQQNIIVPLQLNNANKSLLEISKIILGDGIEFSNGSATINAEQNQINWQYNYMQNNNVFNCTAVWNKIN